jgi:hypothetical protein
MILPPDCQQQHARARQLAPDMADDQQACARPEPLTFSLPGKPRKEVRDTRSKNTTDLRSPLTESNRRPSPYHFSLRHWLLAGLRADLAERERSPAHIGARRDRASTVCHSNATQDDLDPGRHGTQQRSETGWQTSASDTSHSVSPSPMPQPSADLVRAAYPRSCGQAGEYAALGRALPSKARWHEPASGGLSELHRRRAAASRRGRGRHVPLS